MLWAFGNGWASAPYSESPDRWNTRHSDLFIMYGYDSIDYTMMRVGKAYLDRKN